MFQEKKYICHPPTFLPKRGGTIETMKNIGLNVFCDRFEPFLVAFESTQKQLLLRRIRRYEHRIMVKPRWKLFLRMLILHQKIQTP